ncbi:MAG TPA: hypothetical protein VIG80_06095 [Bacillaceae bacterium]
MYMSGMLFHLIMWIVWIHATFIMEKKSKIRFPAAAASLIAIILYPYEAHVFSLRFSGPSFLLGLAGYGLAAMQTVRERIYLLFSVQAIMLGYSGLLFLEMFDPVWMIADRRIVFGVILFLASYFIYPASMILRFQCLLIGTLQGEVLAGYVFGRLQIPFLIGAGPYLDILACFTAALLLANPFGKVIPSASTIRQKDPGNRSQLNQ